MSVVSALVGVLCAATPWQAPPSVPAQWIGSARPKVEQPRRIISLAPSVAEFVYALGAGDRLIGRSRYDDYPKAVLSLPIVGGFLDPNVEAIVAKKPDLVLAVPNSGNRPALERIAKLGIPVYVVPGNSFADTFVAGRALGKVLGGNASKIADGLLKQIIADVQRVQKSDNKKRRRVAWVYDHNPFILAGPGSFADTILEVVGATNIVTVDVAYPTYSIEQLIADAPEVMIDSAATHIAKSKRESWQRWTTIPAVREKRVHKIDASLLLRAGPRIGQAVLQVAKLVR